MTPRVTFVVPVWDEYVRYLPDLLESLAMVAADEDIVLVDNASRYPLELGRYRVVRMPTRVSLGEARNAGLAVVETELVAFWDADDRLVDSAMWSICVDRAASNAEVLAVAGRSVDGRTGETRRWPPPYAAPLARWPRAFAWANAVRCCFVPVAAVLRTRAVRECGGFPPANAAEDWALGARLAFHGRIALIDGQVRWYRIHPDSLWSKEMSLQRFHTHRRLVREWLSTDPRAGRVRRELTGAALASAQLLELYARLMFVERFGLRSERTSTRSEPPRAGRRTSGS